ncbi:MULTISPECIES: hypothetical protein [Methylobacterium]|uniref:Uncharacterized protein n=3 Tax=Pseudomonadota TaxID=1224 RepID=A0ABQ4SVJ1_9HYPH|nr:MULTISPECIES: hypothetical protein [Methylobacterium]PIU05725.1 MAG: hypothetical protein COT56_13190 [Methylobacterium sp. CG09_land_8_20_14_0_10_71_15]PIU15266.1 MAG: hypothetical protein COT28_04900 [Methylobacterium sp. CG08_land_8_20_14_0_20_71_15]GBU19800.1 hypothetical protein AwMethylo_40150 [Methylobacterium sp.]GJE06535.1 hypothetical protein AOPFMNJM_1855 [Methylobacterium jeotgali]
MALSKATAIGALGLALSGAPALAQGGTFGGMSNLPSLGGPAQGEAPLSLSAVFAGSDRLLRSGLTWRIYEDRSDGVRPSIVARSNDAAPVLNLAPGTYVATVTYGFASASRKVAMSGQPVTEQLKISAGALRLSGAIGDARIAPAELSFQVFVPVGTNSEGRLVRGGVKAGEVLRLPEGTYHVVSTYGESNAIQRADLKVENGRLTDATMNHRAATVTLKLVSAPGAEAFAGTAFSVLTPGGDTIREAIGAFPQVTLAEGDYVLIARHDGQVYSREFKVESGLDRDIEVVAKGS